MTEGCGLGPRTSLSLLFSPGILPVSFLLNFHTVASIRNAGLVVIRRLGAGAWGLLFSSFCSFAAASLSQNCCWCCFSGAALQCGAVQWLVAPLPTLYICFWLNIAARNRGLHGDHALFCAHARGVAPLLLLCTALLRRMVCEAVPVTVKCAGCGAQL